MADKSTLDRKHAELGRRALGLELVVMANNAFARYPLPREGVVVLGRGAGVDVDVADPLVSRRHARVHIGEVVELEDLAGVNGTYLAGRRVAANVRVPVREGAVIGIGEALLVVQPKPGRGAGGPATGALSDDGSSALSHIPPHIVIADDEVRRVYGLAALAARSPINVLVLGETGVGKELLAQTVHACSQRSRGPFLALNCATLTDSLLESELFGYEKGSFTGATQAKPGLLEAASGGTVFLDEIGDMALGIQARLLRVLEARESRRIGSLKPRPIDVRFVSATNRDLVAAIQRGEFRRDLYFRLNGLTLSMPPLRERPGDIRLLVERFVEVTSRAMGRERQPKVTADAVARLSEHDWPGNVRELRNVIERAVLLCGRNDIRTEHLIFDDVALGTSSAERPSAAQSPAPPAHVKDEVAALERRRIVQALEANAGNQTKASRSLGMSRGTLLKRLAVYGLSRPRKS
jgi:two-component system response regulator AtoC